MKLEHEAYLLVAECRYLITLQLIYLSTVQHYTSCIGLIERTHYLQQSSLSGSAGSYYAHHFCLTYTQIDAL